MIRRIREYIKAIKYNIGFVDGDVQDIISGKPLCRLFHVRSNDDEG